MDRKSGYAKGYVLIQYAAVEEAQAAIAEMNGQQLDGRKIRVDWAFQEKPLAERKRTK